VNDTVLWIGASLCRFLQPFGGLDAAVESCGEPRQTMALGTMALLMSGISATMLAVMGRNISPRRP
jgi:hypothetical protein